MQRDSEIVRAAQGAVEAIATQQGQAMASVIEAIHHAKVDKALPHAQWAGWEKELVRGVDRVLISGTVGLSEPFGTLARRAAERTLARRFSNVRFQLIPIYERSGIAAAQGAFLLLTAGRSQVKPGSAALLLDIGGTKTHVEIVELNGAASLKRLGAVLWEREFPTPKGPPESALYDGVARQVLDLMQHARVVALSSTVCVSFAAAFERADGGVTWQGMGRVAAGFGFNLGPGIPGSCPVIELGKRLPGFSFHVFTDGVAQFRYAVETALLDPCLRSSIMGRKVMLLAPGTGIGAGFGKVDEQGKVEVYPMTHVSDLIVPDFQDEWLLELCLPSGPVAVTAPTPKPTWAKDVLGGKAIEALAWAIEHTLQATGRAPVFVPFAGSGCNVFPSDVVGSDNQPQRVRLDAEFLNEGILRLGRNQPSQAATHLSVASHSDETMLHQPHGDSAMTRKDLVYALRD